MILEMIRRRPLDQVPLLVGLQRHHGQVHRLLVQLQHQRQRHADTDRGGDGQREGGDERGDDRDL